MTTAWLLQDEIDTVARTAAILATESANVNFVGHAISGSFPAVIMGLLNSSNICTI